MPTTNPANWSATAPSPPRWPARPQQTRCGAGWSPTPLSGTLLDCGRTTYHPPAGLADHVKARDVYCRFPGCRRKAVDAELDHITAWSAGGETSEQNLAACCTHHHRLKHHAGWHVDDEADASLTWTTPTGHRHTTARHDYRPDTAGPAPPP